jgi:protein tyrosine phosphatase (PTP) superfamily phosphohydrolase (DUF442 family)
VRNEAEEIERRLARKFQAEFGALRDRLRLEPEGNPLFWLIPSQLACTRRPLRDHPEYRAYVYEDHLPAEVGSLVVAWVDRILAAGIRSVICLLPDWQLRRYRGLRGMRDGLLALYQKRGIDVAHVPCPDPRHESVKKGWLEGIRPLAYQSFLELPKPVLLHCSAGIDRSSPVAAHIVRLVTAGQNS